VVETSQSSLPIPDFATAPASSSKSKAAPPEKEEEEPSSKSSKRKEKEKASKDEDITKIREKHEKEKNEAAYVDILFLFIPSLLAFAIQPTFPLLVRSLACAVSYFFLPLLIRSSFSHPLPSNLL
jgi:hypothetical protein